MQSTSISQCLRLYKDLVGGYAIEWRMRLHGRVEKESGQVEFN